MQGTDPAAVAASTAQGWAYTLNTVARPAPEHLEAAQEALNALVRADPPSGPLGTAPRWPGVRDALSEALTAARLRVDGGRPPGDITIAELRGALAELRTLGLAGPDMGDIPPPPAAGYPQAYAAADRARVELRERVAELEAELEKAIEREDAEREARTLTDAELRRQVELRDRFERERGQAQRDLKLVRSGRGDAIAAAREDSRRAGYLWTLAQLGMNAPGFDQMGADELREEATTVLGRTLAEAQALRLVAKELGLAARWLGLDYDGAPYVLPGPDRPEELATLVVRLATWSQRARRAALERQTELEDQLEELRPDMDLAAVRAERDMLTRARDAQASELRTLREELAAADRRRAELERELEEARAEATPGALHDLEDRG
jgi:DNA repair exonuclease SbcCD ATPase subunit